MIDKKVLETRKKAYAEINAYIKLVATEGKELRASELALMVSRNHGLTRRFSDDYLRLLEDNNEIILKKSGDGKILSLQVSGV